MAYIKDNDLEFLQYCDTEDLQILVDYLTKDKDGENRFTEELTYTDNYKKYYPSNLPKMWQDIAGELQTFGGNTVANMFRGGGVAYREILIDVAKKQKVNFNKNASVETIEKNILDSVLEQSIHKMNEDELKVFLRELGIENIKAVGSKGFLANLAIQSIKHTMVRGGFGTYKLALIVANQVARAVLGRGLTVATNYALTTWLKKVMVFSGPIGWVVSGIWTLLDIAAPAYRVTIPAVIQIAYMRIKYNTPKEEINWGEETPIPPKTPQNSSEEKVESDENISSNWIYDIPKEEIQQSSENVVKELQEKRIAELEKTIAELKQQLNS